MSMGTFRARVDRHLRQEGIELTQDQVKKAVQAVWDSIVEECVKEETLSVRSFGTFYIHRRPRRTVVNPATGEKHKRGKDGILRLRCRVPIK